MKNTLNKPGKSNRVNHPAASGGVFNPRGSRQMPVQAQSLGSLLAGIKELTSLSAVILSLVLLLTGCLPDNFTPEERRVFLKTAREVVSDFLEKQYRGAKIDNIQPEKDVSTDSYGYELTEFASGQFSWKGRTYNFLVNTETEQVYTSVYLEEAAEGLKDALLQNLCIDASEADVDDITITYLPVKGYTRGSYVESVFENVVPRKDSAEELLQEILQDTEEYVVSMSIQYKGEGLPPEIMEQNALFPALSFVRFYHIAEEHELCQAGEEEFRFSIIPSLSEEILWVRYQQGSPSRYSYTRNEVMEQDGFYVVYNAYEKTMEKDMISESVITEEDIAFTVTEEYIALDCTRDYYIMYLSAADKKKAKKYCYSFDQGGGPKAEITKGMWYAYEDRYVYSDNIYVKTPHRFCDDFSVENIIYTKSASKEPPIFPQSMEFEYTY